MSRSICNIGIVGFGHFGRFMAQHLSSKFDVMVYDRDMRKKRKNLPDRVNWGSLEDVAQKDVVVLAIPALPVSNFKKMLKKIAPKLRNGALVVDVCSVKVTPIKLMQGYLPSNVQILGTHPLFGPKSAANGLRNKHKVAICPVRIEASTLAKVKMVLRHLGVSVLEIEPEHHDQEMAMVLGVTHFVGRALAQAGIRRSKLSTKSYRGLVGSKEIAISDSMALFWNLMMGYPDAPIWIDKVTEAFIEWRTHVRRRVGKNRRAAKETTIAADAGPQKNGERVH